MKEKIQDEILDSIQDLITSLFSLEIIIQDNRDISELQGEEILNKIKKMGGKIEEINNEIDS